jgi:capsular exopolysaccharide synthesis family protein
MGKIQAALERAKSGQDNSESRASGQAAISGADTANMAASGRTGGRISLKDLPPVKIDWDTFTANRLLTHGDNESIHPAQGAYRMLRTRLMQNMRSNGWRIVGISSIAQTEGKTYTAINLAISIAAEIGQEVVLVDLDLQRPSVHASLGIDPSKFTGLREFLENNTQDLQDLLVSTDVERLSALLSGNPMQGSSDLLSSASGKKLFSDLRERLPPDAIVVVDLPPLLVTDDALAVAPMLDGLLLVVAEGQTERSDVSEAKQVLQEFNLIGTILNKSVEKDSKRAHYY